MTNTQLIPNEDGEYYPTKLPDHYLNVRGFFITEKAYEVLKNLEDDCILDDLIKEDQVSLGAEEMLYNLKNQAFENYNKDGDFTVAMAKFQRNINNWLETLEKSNLVIN